MITFKSATELEAMRQSSRIVAVVLGELEPLIRPGIRTRDLDLYAEKRTRELGAVPAFKGYRGYPASVCVSVNEEIIHGIPSGRILQEGDIVSLDFGVLYEGFYSDSALTAPVGRASAEALKLIAAAERSFFKGLEQMKEGNRLSDISAAIQAVGRERGLRGHPPVRRARHRPGPPRRAPGPELRGAGARPEDPDGHDPGHRAHDRRRGLRRRDPGGRLDGRHPGPQPGRPLRAHGGPDRERPGDPQREASRTPAGRRTRLPKESPHA